MNWSGLAYPLESSTRPQFERAGVGACTAGGARDDTLVLLILERWHERQAQAVLRNLHRQRTADSGCRRAGCEVQVGRAHEARRVAARRYEAAGPEESSGGAAHPSWRHPVPTEREIGIVAVRKLHQRRRRAGA